MITIARGDLALETKPLHLSVPFLQEKIKQECRAQGKPFVVATQILESMTDNPAPTRAEISDLYRAVVIDQADYIMLSGETATGQFPTICVNLMHSMINYKDIQTALNPKKVAGQEVVSYQIQSIQ
jgi:pyruvate kinase